LQACRPVDERAVKEYPSEYHDSDHAECPWATRRSSCVSVSDDRKLWTVLSLAYNSSDTFCHIHGGSDNLIYRHGVRGVARILGLGGRPCRVEPDPASTEVAKPMRLGRVLPQKNFVILFSGGGHFPPCPPLATPLGVNKITIINCNR